MEIFSASNHYGCSEFDQLTRGVFVAPVITIKHIIKLKKRALVNTDLAGQWKLRHILSIFNPFQRYYSWSSLDSKRVNSKLLFCMMMIKVTFAEWGFKGISFTVHHNFAESDEIFFYNFIAVRFLHRRFHLTVFGGGARQQVCYVIIAAR